MLTEIIANRQVGPDYYRLDLRLSRKLEGVRPGRFFHLQIRKDELISEPLLRRPFSVFDYSAQDCLLSLVYCVVGRGTKIMARMRPGEEVDVLGPLGTGFRTDFAGNKPLLIGGGMGTAPLYYLLKEVIKDNDPLVYLGGTTTEDMVYFRTEFGKLYKEFGDRDCSRRLLMATLDGSCGFQGTVIDHLQEKNKFLNDVDFVYCCGPDGMLAKVQTLAEKFGLPGQLSVEERMGCGYGVCLSCSCSTTDGNQRVCKEGPVFEIGEVIFDE